MKMAPRIWFKEDMARAILNGKKTSTTRDHERKEGTYLAVMGSRFEARPFATIRIQRIEVTTWAEVFEQHWRTEGFNSPEHMRQWCKANGLAESTGHVFLHHFVLTGVPSIFKAERLESDGA